MQDGNTNPAGKIKVDISDFNMKAYVTINPPTNPEDENLSLQDVLDSLQNAQVKFGINNDAILSAINEKKWDEKFLAAEGTAAVNGQDGTVEYFFPLDVSYKPHIREDGHIDYKEVNVVNSVVKDSVLIKVKHSTSGSDGTDVYGHKLPAFPGKDIDIKTGAGVYKDPIDNSVIRAGIDGIICFNSKSLFIEVQKLYVVQKSVDYSTGNLNVKSSIDIKGDVKPDFSVTTPYNIEVKGVIEQATITCEGTLTVRVGIKGGGEKLIKTGGDIHAGYIQNANVKCRGSVYASTEIRNSFVECHDEVAMVKAGGVIIGGKITATNKVTANSIGNLYYIPTEVEVGVNFQFREKYLEKEGNIKTAQKVFEELSKKIEFIEQKPPDEVKGPSVSNLKAQKAEYSKELERLRHDLKEIEKDYYNVADPVIIVSRKVFPGTLLKIKGASFEVKDEISNAVFRYEDGEIKYSSK